MCARSNPRPAYAMGRPRLQQHHAVQYPGRIFRRRNRQGSRRIRRDQTALSRRAFSAAQYDTRRVRARKTCRQSNAARMGDKHSNRPIFSADTSTKPPAAPTASGKRSASTWGKTDTHLKFNCGCSRCESFLVGRINHELTAVPGAFAGRAHTLRAVQFQMYQTPLAR